MAIVILIRGIVVAELMFFRSGCKRFAKPKDQCVLWALVIVFIVKYTIAPPIMQEFDEI